MRVTRALWAAKYTLGSPSSLVRVRGSPRAPEGDFAIYPDFYRPSESRALLSFALWKLDRVDSKRRRRGRKQEEKPEQQQQQQGRLAALHDMFVGPYGFEEGHFDSVIHQYRESLITSLPSDASAELSGVLGRLYALVPSLEVGTIPPPGSSTHALHLAPEGAILAHVDNVDASGETIVGASLGATRILRLENGDGDGWDVLLPSGSVYMQKGSVRYEYKHSILSYDESRWEGVPLVPGHRVSFMVRDAKEPTH